MSFDRMQRRPGLRCAPSGCTSHQIAPKILGEMMRDKDRARAKRVAEATLQMVKLDIAGLREAYDRA